MPNSAPGSAVTLQLTSRHSGGRVSRTFIISSKQLRPSPHRSLVRSYPSALPCQGCGAQGSPEVSPGCLLNSARVSGNHMGCPVCSGPAEAGYPRCTPTLRLPHNQMPVRWVLRLRLRMLADLTGSGASGEPYQFISLSSLPKGPEHSWVCSAGVTVAEWLTRPSSQIY